MMWKYGYPQNVSRRAIAVLFLSCVAAHAATNAQERSSPAAALPMPTTVQRDLHDIAAALKTANERRPSSTDERNAAAQEKVARLAPAMWKAALAEICTTLLGLALLAATLFYTKRAAQAATDAVAEAQNATRVTRRIGETQTRAYVKIDSATFSFTAKDDPEIIYPVVKISATNSGESPATGFRWRVWTLYGYIGGAGEIYPGRELAEEWGVTIASRDKLVQEERCLSAYFRSADIDAFKYWEGFQVMFEIETVYKDVFDCEHREKAVFQCNAVSLGDKDRALNRTARTLSEMSDEFRTALPAKPLTVADQDDNRPAT